MDGSLIGAGWRFYVCLKKKQIYACLQMMGTTTNETAIRELLPEDLESNQRYMGESSSMCVDLSVPGML